MIQPFIIVATQRSGSTWLVDLLNSHPEIEAHGELFNTEGEGRPPRGARSLPFFKTWRELTKGDLKTYIKLLFQPDVNRKKARGCKIMATQFGANPGLLEALCKHEVRAIHLIRRNFLDIILSKNATAARNIFHASRDETVKQIDVHLDPDNLLKRLHEQEREVSLGRRLSENFPHTELFYEDILKDPRLLKDILTFLTVASDQALTTNMQKLNIAPKMDLIANYDAIRDILIDTEYGWMLEEN